MRSFVKIKFLRSRELILSFTDIGNSNVANLSFKLNAIRKNKILENNVKFTEVPESYKLANFVLFILCSVANLSKE